MTRGKRALIIGAGVLGLLLVLFVAVAFLLPAERIGQIAVARAEAVLDREVRIEDFGVRILPRPAVTLEGVAVSRHARPSPEGEALAAEGEVSGGQAPDGEAVGAEFDPVLATVGRIDLRPRLLPLMLGRVVIHEMVIAEPTLMLVIPEGGTLDLPSIDDAEPDGDPAEIRIRTVRVRNGRVAYRDGNTGNALTLDRIDHRLGIDGPLEAGATAPLTFEGVLSIGGIVAQSPGTGDRPVSAPPVTVEHDMVLVRADDRLDVRRLDLMLGEVPVTAAGTVEAVRDSADRRVSLEARTEALDVGSLLRSLPDELVERMPRGPDEARLAGTAGTVDLDATISGRWGGGEMPDVSGRMLLEGVALAFGEEDRRRRARPLVEGLEGEVRFSLDLAWTDGLSGRLLGEPVDIAFRLHDPADPRGSLTALGALDLEEAARAGILPEGLEGRGRLVVDVSAEGATADPAAARVDGRLDLEGVELAWEGFARPVAVADGRIELAGGGIAARGLGFTMGPSDITLDLEVGDWPAFALAGDERALSVRFDLRSTVLDADDLLDADPERTPYGQLLFAHLGERPVNGRTAARAADEMGLELPRVPEYRVDGRVRAGTVISTGVAHRDLDATLAARDGHLEIPAATLETMGGRVELSAWLGRGTEGDDGLRPAALRVAVTDVTADPFLEHHTLFRGRVGGSLVLTGSAEMRLHPNALPGPESVVGEGTIGVMDGELRNWPLVWELGRTVGVDLETLAFQDWTARYVIAGSRILIEESRLEGRELGARASGSFDVAGNLDLSATLHLPAAWVGRIPGVPAGLLASLLADPEGRIPVGAVVTGTTSSPTVGLDLTEVGAIAAARAREEAERRVREEAERISRELGLDLPTPDPRVEAADTLRSRLEAELRTRLRRVIPDGGGDRGGVPPTVPRDP